MALAEGFRGTPFEGSLRGILEAHEKAYAAAFKAMDQAGADQYQSFLTAAENGQTNGN